MDDSGDPAVWSLRSSSHVTVCSAPVVGGVVRNRYSWHKLALTLVFVQKCRGDRHLPTLPCASAMQQCKTDRLRLGTRPCRIYQEPISGRPHRRALGIAAKRFMPSLEMAMVLSSPNKTWKYRPLSDAANWVACQAAVDPHSASRLGTKSSYFCSLHQVHLRAK
jgi:hypothetical protein